MNQVELGSKIIVEFESEEKENFQIVSRGEGDVTRAKVSTDTPFGKAVIGATEGKKITYLNNLRKPISCRILKVI